MLVKRKGEDWWGKPKAVKLENKKNYSKKHQKYKVGIPIAYLYVFFKLRESLKKHLSFSFMQTSEVLEVLKMTLKVPRKMKYLVLAEMQAYGLLNRINHQKYSISNKKEHIKAMDKIKECLDDYPFW